MYKKYTFSDGTRFIYTPMKSTQAVTVLVMTGVGSRYETLRLSGASHFVEHLMFKGTERRPNTLAISKELDGVGAEYNAFTGKDYTGYYIKISSDKLSLALDMLSDMLHNSVFDSEEVEREKRVIKEEIKMYEDNPMAHVEDIFEELMFGDDHPLGRNIAGTRKTVSDITRDELFAYKNKHYIPKNTVISIAGNASKDVRKLVEKYFVQTIKGKKQTFTKYISKQTSPQVHVEYKKTEQSHMILGFKGYAYKHKDLAALQLLSILLGGNMSSRLFISVRERRGLCYFIRAHTHAFQDTGFFSIQAGLDKERICEAIEVIIDELQLISQHGVQNSELMRAKKFIKGKTALGLEESSDVASWYGTQELMTNKTETPKQKLTKLFAVTSQDIQRVAKKILIKETASLAIIGPFKDDKKFISLIKKL